MFYSLVRIKAVFLCIREGVLIGIGNGKVKDGSCKGEGVILRRVHIR